MTKKQSNIYFPIKNICHTNNHRLIKPPLYTTKFAKSKTIIIIIKPVQSKTYIQNYCIEYLVKQDIIVNLFFFI